jgi:membrane protein
MNEHILGVGGVGRVAAREWRGILVRLKERVSRGHLGLVAAGVAFYGLLAAFPALAALIALYGLLFDAQQVSNQVAALQGLLPEQALDFIVAQLQGLVQTEGIALGWGAAAALVLTLWSASKGIKTLIEALNVVYEVGESRGFFRRNALALLLTLGAIVGAAFTIATVVFLPAVIAFLGLKTPLGTAVAYARWPILAVAAAAALGVLYRYGPNRDRPSWALVGWGAVVATLLWLGASALFSFYVSNFGSFNRAYGSVAAIVILLIWLLLSAFVILIGAEFNAVLEREAGRGGPDSRGGTAQTGSSPSRGCPRGQRIEGQKMNRLQPP